MDTRILPKAIFKKFRPINIEDAEDSFIEVKDNQLKIFWGWNDNQSIRTIFNWQNLRETHYLIYVFLIPCLIAIIYFFYDFFRCISNGKIVDSLFSLIPLLIVAGVLIYLFYSISGSITLNRQEGTIFLSRFLGLKSITANFADDKEFVFRLVSSFRFGQNLSLSIRFIQAKHECEVDFWDYEETLSLFTHYMDRNRPLPEGTAFDPYRQEDYERRKAEGFPKPMFPSTIPMTDVDGDTKRYKKG